MLSRPVPEGDAGVEQTVRWMQALVQGRGGVRSPQVRAAALEAARGVERGQHEIDAVYQWVKDNIEFRGEYGETLQEPMITLQWQAGDCDDQSTLAAAMLGSLGYETRFRTVALDGSADEYSHVYVEVRDRETGQWVPLDTTVQRAYPGWEPENIARERTYGVIQPPSSSPETSLLGIALTIGAFFL